MPSNENEALCAMPEMDILVRDYSPEDQAAVMALADRLTVGVAAWRSTDSVRQAVRGWVESSLAGASNGEKTAVFVAVDDDRIVGFVCVCTSRHWSGELDAYIGELVVRENREGRGIGRSLVATAETWARAQGLQRIRLATGAANEAALGMYESIGYSLEDVTLSRPLHASRSEEGAGHAGGAVDGVAAPSPRFRSARQAPCRGLGG